MEMISSEDIAKIQTSFWGHRSLPPMTTTTRRSRLEHFVKCAYQSRIGEFHFKIKSNLFICERSFVVLIGMAGPLIELQQRSTSLVKVEFPRNWKGMKNHAFGGIQTEFLPQKQTRDKDPTKFEDAAAFLIQ
jgi:hypothetical protein